MTYYIKSIRADNSTSWDSVQSTERKNKAQSLMHTLLSEGAVAVAMYDDDNFLCELSTNGTTKMSPTKPEILTKKQLKKSILKSKLKLEKISKEVRKTEKSQNKLVKQRDKITNLVAAKTVYLEILLKEKEYLTVRQEEFIKNLNDITVLQQHASALPETETLN